MSSIIPVCREVEAGSGVRVLIYLNRIMPNRGENVPATFHRVLALAFPDVSQEHWRCPGFEPAPISLAGAKARLL
jgi:hypothetical protein